MLAGAAVVGDHVLRLLFTDGTADDIDFSAEHWTGVLEPLNDSAYFSHCLSWLLVGVPSPSPAVSR